MSGLAAEEIVVAAHGSINIAPSAGAHLPTDMGALDAAFVNVGFVTENGVKFTATPTVNDILAWQSATPVRRVVNSRTQDITSVLEQWNPETFALAFGGGEWSEPSTDVFRYDPPADTDALAEYAVVIDANDGARNFRWVIYRATVNDAVESDLVRTGAALLPIKLSALTPEGQTRGWYFLSDDPTFADFS